MSENKGLVPNVGPEVASVDAGPQSPAPSPAEAVDRFITAFPALRFAARDKRGKFPMAALKRVKTDKGENFDMVPLTVAMTQETFDEIKALVAAMPAIRAHLAALAATREELSEAVDLLNGVEVFVKSREQINKPTGREWFDKRLARARAAISPSPTLDQPGKGEGL